MDDSRTPSTIAPFSAILRSVAEGGICSMAACAGTAGAAVAACAAAVANENAAAAITQALRHVRARGRAGDCGSFMMSSFVAAVSMHGMFVRQRRPRVRPACPSCRAGSRSG